MLQGMTAQELADWHAFDSIDPVGDERADLRMGILAQLIATVHTTKKGKRWKPADFMPFVTKQDRQKSLSKQIGKFFGRQHSKKPDR